MSSGNTNFSAITADDLSLMIAKLDGLKKQGARFWMHGQILHYIRNLKDSNDRPIFIETVGAPMSGTIWGYPYSEVIKMPSTSGANTAFVAFGNLRYFSVGRRLDTTTLQVDPYGLWTTNRTRFKLYQRWGMKIGLANGFVRLLTSAV
jgi:HK97 family phage major capsid protein